MVSTVERWTRKGTKGPFDDRIYSDERVSCVSCPKMQIGNDSSTQVWFNPEKNAASLADAEIVTCTSRLIFFSLVQPQR